MGSLTEELTLRLTPNDGPQVSENGLRHRRRFPPRGAVVGDRPGRSSALRRSAVHALGLIGGTAARLPLLVLSLAHPNPLVREQAKQTLARPRRAGEGM
jgi:hypothetical protein